jgi:hypothetical protein
LDATLLLPGACLGRITIISGFAKPGSHHVHTSWLLRVGKEVKP